MNWLKRHYLSHKGYVYNKKYRWWVNTTTLEAICDTCTFLNIYRQNIKYKKLGSWTFYAPTARLSMDILDTLRDDFSIKKEIMIRRLY